ncbi:MAG: hypothetical protein E7271_09270 [Lachnospiraceae bacterium]|jgi:hypothetical protein|nr:hypothetical protein [Lachnospiraceae bacterium]
MGKNKKIIIAICVVFVIAIVAAVVLLYSKKKDGYRLLKVFEVEGTANVNRDGTGDIEPYANMVLESGDTVSLTKGTFTIKADEDKYIYLEDGTELKLNATGTSENSKTTIDLVAGAITNDIQNKLSSESSYEVNTPNSTMSVRGTIYRVEVFEKDGVKYTKVSVFNGEVVTKLIYADGTISDEEVSVEEGKEVLIYDDGKTVDYVSEPKDIDYSQLPETVLKKLLDYINKDDRDVSGDDKEIEKILYGPFEVTFSHNGTVFGTQTVEKGSCAQMPSLQPSESGSWDYDFSQPVYGDLTIEWK